MKVMRQIVKVKERNKKLQNQVIGLRDLLKHRDEQARELRKELEIHRQGYDELMKIVSGWFALLLEEKGGRIEVDKNELAELMKKHKYKVTVEGDKIIISESAE